MLVSAASSGLVWGLVRGNAAGWSSPEVVGTLAAGALLAVGFVAWERHTPTPMLPMRLFRSGAFSAGNAAVFCLNGSMAGAIFFTAQFEQVTLGHGALGAGLGLLPWGIAPFLLAVTKSATGSVAPGDVGTASGAYTTMRQLGGAFGVARSWPRCSPRPAATPHHWCSQPATRPPSAPQRRCPCWARSSPLALPRQATRIRPTPVTAGLVTSRQGETR